MPPSPSTLPLSFPQSPPMTFCIDHFADMTNSHGMMIIFYTILRYFYYFIMIPIVITISTVITQNFYTINIIAHILI